MGAGRPRDRAARLPVVVVSRRGADRRSDCGAHLTHYNLFQYFLDGAFAEDAGSRSSIAARALKLARDAGPVADNGIFVVGDTPHDIECANAIGARTIAVATGGYSRDELQSHRPWRVFDELPAAEEFARLIDEARRA